MTGIVDAEELWKRSRSGARAGRGFRFQDAAAAAAAVLCWAGRIQGIAVVPEGFHSYHLADWTEYHTKRPLPAGNYVPIDYTAMGDITNPMGRDWVLKSACEAVRMYGEG